MELLLTEAIGCCCSRKSTSTSAGWCTNSPLSGVGGWGGGGMCTNSPLSGGVGVCVWGGVCVPTVH